MKVTLNKIIKRERETDRRTERDTHRVRKNSNSKTLILKDNSERQTDRHKKTNKKTNTLTHSRSTLSSDN